MIRLNGELNQHDEAVLALHNNPIEYQARIVKANGHIVHGQVAQLARREILNSDTVADLGSGVGTLAEILIRQKHKGIRIANDISEPYLRHLDQLGFYQQTYLGTIDSFCCSMIDRGKKVDWAVMVSVTYYLSPERLSNILTALSHFCCSGVILTVDAIPAEVAKSWARDNVDPVTVYNHRETIMEMAADGFPEREIVWSDIGWSASLTGQEIPVDLVLLRSRC